jgi:pimeloyl-[acyl-carrier protein] synthase
MDTAQTRPPAPNFSQLSVLGRDLFAQLETVREAERVAWNDSVKGWLITRHEDVVAGFEAKVPLSCIRMEARSFGKDEMEAFAKRYPLTVSSLPNWIVNADPPRHTRLRNLMTRAFSRKIVENLRPFAKQTIANVLDSIADREEIEFMEHVARQITGRVILHKFGLSDEYLQHLKKWSVSFSSGLGGVVEPGPTVMDTVEESIAEMQEIFKGEIARRRARPTEDFLSQLILAREADDTLTEEEILGICYLVIVAGHDTTLNTMTLGVSALSKNEAARQYMFEHPDGILNSVMEVMRYIAMSTAFNRVAAEDFVWHGKQIRKGDLVWLMVAGANRDPRVYDDPESMDLKRRTDQVTVFGLGIHHCIGHLLAKMQLCEFYPAFFTRFPDAKVLDKELDFQPAFSFRGLTGMNVRLR